jgi:uncharacterized glyoxalase superfamily protein PhnB
MTNTLTATNLSASLTVKDLERSRAWYCDVVGFALDREIEREGKVVAVAVRAGDVRLMLNQDNGAKGADRVKGEGFSMMISTAENVDEIAERIKKGGGTLDTEPADMPWGTRAFRVTDPDGFKFAFSTPIQR